MLQSQGPRCCGDGVSCGRIGQDARSGLHTFSHRPLPRQISSLQRGAGRITTPTSCRSTSSGSSSKFSQDAEKFARDAQRRAAAFAKEQQLQERASQAATSSRAWLGEAFESAKVNASRAYMKLDSEYDISERARRARRRAVEAAADLDQTYSLRRRVRNSLEYLQRRWPVWQRRLDEVGQTGPGKVAIFLAIAAVVSTPLFWRVLNFGLFMWWLALPMALVAMESARRKQAEEFAARQAEAEVHQREQQAASPLGDMFRSFSRAARGGGGKSKASGGAASRPSAAGGGGSRWQQGGPVIDAEWSNLDG